MRTLLLEDGREVGVGVETGACVHVDTILVAGASGTRTIVMGCPGFLARRA